MKLERKDHWPTKVVNRLIIVVIDCYTGLSRSIYKRKDTMYQHLISTPTDLRCDEKHTGLVECGASRHKKVHEGQESNVLIGIRRFGRIRSIIDY